MMASMQQLMNPLRRLAPRELVLLSAGFLFCAGLVMVASASMGVAEARYGGAFFFLTRHLIYLLIGGVAAWVVLQIPMAWWRQHAYLLFVVALILLVLVLIPGIGKRVNGSMRWIGVGGFTLQPSEIAKFTILLALSAYLVRRQDKVRSDWSGFFNPMIFVVVVAGLLLAEPDFGATVVIVTTMVLMFLLAGSRMYQLSAIGVALLVLAVCAVLLEPYRLRRMLSFTNPWADQFSSGYQLVQSLIAFGRGDWFGVGLGQSVQKMFYLPEAHTDFVFAIYAEEFGLVGVLLMLGAFLTLSFSIFRIGQRAERREQSFNAYVAYGISLMLAIQVAINIGVNVGLLPTKGLTLPLVSYGGSSLVMILITLAVVLRIDSESSGEEVRQYRHARGAS